MSFEHIVEPSYIIFKENGNYIARNGKTGAITSTNADADTVINAALTAGGAGAVVYLAEKTTFSINDPVTLTANNQVLVGGGRSTFIDGDGLADTEHAIVISGRTDCIVRDLAIQTQDGGTKTCHCVFIEDGSDRFHIENVWIVDSDSDGVHIEGTNISEGWILNCKILDVDDNGILSNMDGGSTLEYLQVKDCKISGAGVDGISLTESNYAEILNNIITSSGSDGIALSNSDDTQIDNNIILASTAYDINISDATCDRTRVGIQRLAGAGTACLNDAGTATRLPTIKDDFTNHAGGSAGWTDPVINTSPGGIDIDANDEFAYMHVTLQSELQQVVRIKIWAYSNVDEADAMRLRIVAHGATDNEAWNGNAIDVADHPSESSNFVTGDVIYWLIDVGDDAQVGTLAAQDYIELLAVGEIAGGDDCATDALFGGYEIEHV